MKTTANHLIRCYLLWRRMLYGAFSLAEILSTGFWLGLLRRSDWEQLDEVSYNGQRMYQDEDYNRSGLFSWERELVERYFGVARRLLVTSAGGGREVLALLRMGYDVDAFECNPTLVASANRLLAAEGWTASVLPAERDRCPELHGPYDGVIVGWASFMHIQGSRQRLRLLRDLRELMQPGAPILLSFFPREAQRRRFGVMLSVGNALRRLTGRELLELGDDLAPEYLHRFVREEVERALAAAGFDPVFFTAQEYGQAIGIALPDAASLEPVASPTRELANWA